MEYRERTAKLCVKRACARPEAGENSSAQYDPIRYIRRACELCACEDVRVPGLSHQVVEYLNQHTSNAYDARGESSDEPV